MTELEIALSVACAVLFVVWRHAVKEASEHYEAACMFKTSLFKIAKNEATVSISPDGEKIQLKITEAHKAIEL